MPEHPPHQIRDREVLDGLEGYQTALSIGGREFVCRECGARCTESPSGDIEYGHRGWCSHSAGRISRSDSKSRAAERREHAKRLGGES